MTVTVLTPAILAELTRLFLVATDQAEFSLTRQQARADLREMLASPDIHAALVAAATERALTFMTTAAVEDALRDEGIDLAAGLGRLHERLMGMREAHP